MRKIKNGFTLVELLAVIVVLAIILVIAVPKVMTIIEDSKKAALETTAKMIANAAEKAKIQNELLGKTDRITCESVAKINKQDYENCIIKFDENTAKVDIKGSGKFNGIYVCGATKNNAIATEEGCGVVSVTINLAGGTDTVDYDSSYEPGTEITLTVPTREGYSFMGWGVTGTSANITNNKLKVGTSTTIVTALWEEYSVDYPILLSGPDVNQAIGYSGYGEIISEVSFVDSYTPKENDPEPVDVSQAQDGSILAYFIQTSETDAKAIIVGNGSGGILLNEDSSIMFLYMIGLKTVYGMDLLRWVNVKNNEAMFAYTGIENVDLGNIRVIGNAFFLECYNLKNITIPNTVTTIGDSAFAGAINLESILIPSSVTSVGDFAFSKCEKIESIDVVSDNNVYTTKDGVLYTKDMEKLVAYPNGRKQTTLIIPNTVTTIGDSAFYECTSLTSVIIPNSVKIIEEKAFYRSTGLTNITISEGVTTIGDSAFLGCENVTNITIPSTVTSIGDSAFRECSSITNITIPDGVTSIGNFVFYECHNLESITIPESVASIGNYAFHYCYNLESITIPESVTIIGASAFGNCWNLKSITIPKSVTSIGTSVFVSCSKLESINVDANNKYYISNDGVLYTKDMKKLVAYPSAKTATTLTIPDGVTNIETFALHDYNSLTSIIIPKSVTSIGNYAFSYCREIKDVYYTGTSTDWDKITIGSYNDYIKNATKHYEYAITN